jgi:hypothetical protein
MSTHRTTPFGLSLSKAPSHLHKRSHKGFDKLSPTLRYLRACGRSGFDKLSPNGVWLGPNGDNKCAACT